MKFNCLFLLLLLAPSIASAFEADVDLLADNLAKRLESAGKRTVAVVDFTDVSGNRTELGRFLAEEVSVSLLSSPRTFRVVDRAHLSKLLEEMKLGESGVVDPSTAKEVGRIAGVDALITGTLTPLESTVRLTVKVLETETAGVIAGDRVSLQANSTMRELLARGLVHGGAGGSTTADTGAVHTRAYNMESREAGGLRVTVRSVRLLQDSRVSAQIELQNIAATPLRVGIPGLAYGLSTVADNTGKEYRSGAYDSSVSENFDCRDGGLMIESGEVQQVTQRYSLSTGKGAPGQIFQLSLGLRICSSQDREWEDGRYVSFSFSDLRVDPLVGH